VTGETRFSSFRSDIQVLRGIAIILVLLFHLPSKAFQFGYLGVDVFFVVSGYLIAPRILALFDETPNVALLLKNISRFTKNRIRRLAPAFAITLLIFLPLLLLVGDINLQNLIVRQAIAGSFILGNFGAYKFGGDYFHPGIENPLVHFWSLSVEEQIYIFLPISFILLFIVNRKRFKQNGRLLFFLLFLFSLFLTFYSEYLNSLYSHFFAVPDSFSFYSPITRFWEFAAGGLLSITHLSRVKISLNILSKYLFIFLFFTSLFFTVSMSANYIILVVVTATCALIFTNSLNSLPERVSSFLCYFGDRSYSLYLVHLPVFYIIISSPIAQRYFDKSNVFTSLIALIVAMLLSDLVYRFVELRFHNIRGANAVKAIKSGSSRLMLILVASSIALSLISSPIVGSGFFGLINTKSTDNPGAYFKEFCIRDNPIYQFPCSFPGDGKEGTIALLGDSHASQYSLVLWEIAKTRGLKLIIIGDFGGEVNSSRTIRTLKSINPSYIIVSKYWRSEYLKSNSEMIQDLLTIRDVNKNLVVVGQNPIFEDADSNPGHSLLQVLLGIEAVETSLSASGVPLRESRVADGLIRAWARDSKVQYLDSYRVLCPGYTCDKVVGGKPLYIDSNHLSGLGALNLRSEFAKVFDAWK
jgi:peptidoglycan/LPS O-acetylase OafA/YrhL